MLIPPIAERVRHGCSDLPLVGELTAVIFGDPVRYHQLKVSADF